MFEEDDLHSKNDVIAQMDAIRSIRGLPPINSMTIQGSPGPEAFGMRRSPEPEFDPVNLDEVVEPDPPSPLRQLAENYPQASPTPTAQVESYPTSPIHPQSRVMVQDRSASFEGHLVELTRAEQDVVARVILEALIARAKEALHRVSAPPPPAAPPPPPELPIKRKRGRPRKVVSV